MSFPNVVLTQMGDLWHVVLAMAKLNLGGAKKAGADGAQPRPQPSSGSSGELFPRSQLKALTPEGDAVCCATNNESFAFSEEHLLPSPVSVSERSPASQHHQKHSPLAMLASGPSTAPSSGCGFVSLSPQTSNSSSSSTGDADGDDQGSKSYECEFCDARFKIKGYLTRHMKKHSNTKAYHCPFHEGASANKCHATGAFSRRDTFKTHLKSRHFKYPPGVKSNNRTGMCGWCGMCGEKFINNEIWVERHIEGGKCPLLPQEYLQTLNPGKKKTGKHSKFLDVANVSESLQLSSMNSPAPSVGFEAAQPNPLAYSSPNYMLQNRAYNNVSYSQPSSAAATPQHHQLNGLQQQYQSPLSSTATAAVDPEIDVLVRRKMVLEQYIQTLQRAALVQEHQIQLHRSYGLAPVTSGSSVQSAATTVVAAVNGEDEFPSLEEKSVGYPVNSALSLEDA